MFLKKLLLQFLFIVVTGFDWYDTSTNIVTKKRGRSAGLLSLSRPTLQNILSFLQMEKITQLEIFEELYLEYHKSNICYVCDNGADIIFDNSLHKPCYQRYRQWLKENKKQHSQSNVKDFVAGLPDEVVMYKGAVSDIKQYITPGFLKQIDMGMQISTNKNH